MKELLNPYKQHTKIDQSYDHNIIQTTMFRRQSEGSVRCL